MVTINLLDFGYNRYFFATKQFLISKELWIIRDYLW